MGTAVVVPNEFTQDAFGVAVVEHDHVVQAASPQGLDYAFAIRVRLRGPRRCHQASGAEALHPPSEINPVDRVAVTDKKRGARLSRSYTASTKDCAAY